MEINPKVATAFFSGNGFTETFTKAHIDNLPVKYKLTGGVPPRFLNGKPIVQLSIFKRLLNRIKPDKQLQDPYYPLVFFLKKKCPDVMVVEYGNAAADIMPYCLEAGVPLIACYYGYDAFRYDVLEKYKEKYNFLFRHAKYVSTQSQSIANKLESLGCPASKLVVNPCPPSQQFTNVKCDIQSNTFIAVGRFVEKKAPLITIAAFAKVHKKNPFARLVFAGDGPLLDASRFLAKDLGIEQAVEFPGRISQETQQKFFSNSFCFLQHSIVSPDGDQEGLPVAIMEAMTTGMPVVSTLHSGIPEVVQHNKTGFLVAENDKDAMAEAMCTLFTNREMCFEFGKKGREWMLQTLTMKAHIHKLEYMIETAIQSGQ